MLSHIGISLCESYTACTSTCRTWAVHIQTARWNILLFSISGDHLWFFDLHVREHHIFLLVAVYLKMVLPAGSLVISWHTIWQWRPFWCGLKYCELAWSIKNVLVLSYWLLKTILCPICSRDLCGVIFWPTFGNVLKNSLGNGIRLAAKFQIYHNNKRSWNKLINKFKSVVIR